MVSPSPMPQVQLGGIWLRRGQFRRGLRLGSQITETRTFGVCGGDWGPGGELPGLSRMSRPCAILGHWEAPLKAVGAADAGSSLEPAGSVGQNGVEPLPS